MKQQEEGHKRKIETMNQYDIVKTKVCDFPDGSQGFSMELKFDKRVEVYV